MKYAIVSDLHANWQAWSAVCAGIAARDAETMVCLGDVVGYGPSPMRVLNDLCNCCENLVLGNHDAAAVNRLDRSIFNPAARRAVEWTMRQLDEPSRRLLEEWPVLVEDSEALFVHSDPVAPDDYSYVETPEDVRACFNVTDKRYIFLGHTHMPEIWVMTPRGELVRHPGASVTLEPGARALVNVGSVGDPRDGSDQASFCLCDTDLGHIELFKTPFDYESFSAEVRQHPELQLPWFLERHAAVQGSPLRQHAMAAGVVARERIRVGSKKAQLKVLHKLPHLTTLAAYTGSTESARRSGPDKPVSKRLTTRAMAVWGSALLFSALATCGVLVSRCHDKSPRREKAAKSSAIRRAPTTTTDVAVAAPQALPVVAPLCLRAAAAQLKGSATLKCSADGDNSTIGYWFNLKDYLVWNMAVKEAGNYEVVLNYALDPKSAGSEAVLLCGKARLPIWLKATASWDAYTKMSCGRIRLPEGPVVVQLRATKKPGPAVMNLRSITFTHDLGDGKR